ncbi:histidine phosphatase family protein [Pseudothauera nasutitermitis]|uniref:Histidine phosphatase family protein n=1 Tax=Pseudothauera nasutitermitis TaxID=2565930 RepID=A0A4S4B225_9RHOO|nr:histidine phosphatase family protein [Pseudothauera nasutitermitis]THF66543.1 histidine phosphatase family protein [Pseudothauera nasutitermitis]
MPRIILVRHGQASFGAADYDCLSSQGVEQARHLGKVLHARGENIDALWCGTLLRHQQTAANLLQGSAWALEPRSLAGFDEFDHQQVIARYEPRYSNHQTMVDEIGAATDPHEAFARMYGKALARWYGGTADSDYDEPWNRFQTRCQSALEQVIDRAGRDETHLVVTSGGVIAVLVQAMLGLGNAATMRINWTLANAGMTTLQAGNTRQWQLLSLNEHSHFRGHHRYLLTWR